MSKLNGDEYLGEEIPIQEAEIAYIESGSIELSKGIEDIELKSEEVQEVLGNPPHWLIRSGMSLIGVLTILILIASYILKYPDKISTQAEILGSNPPVSVMARQSGKITHLFVEDKSTVKEGQVLGVLESLAEYEDVCQLKNWFEPLIEKDFPIHDVVNTSRSDLEKLRLGSLNTPLMELIKALDEYSFFIRQDYHLTLIQKLQQDIRNNEKLLLGMESKHEMAIQSFRFTEGSYKSNQKLLDQGVISQKEFEQVAKGYFNEKAGIEDLRMGIRQKKMAITGLEEQIWKNSHQSKQQSSQFTNQIKLISNRLESDIKKWEENYLLLAPSDGVVSFFEFWNQQEDVKTGDEVMVVLPGTNEIFAYAKLEAANSGKVLPGQRVRLELDNYPSQEFGTVRGEVASISKVARKGKYAIRMTLPEGLKTNYGKTVEFSQEMPATAHIITEELRLIDRVFFKLRNTYKTLQDE